MKRVITAKTLMLAFVVAPALATAVSGIAITPANAQGFQDVLRNVLGTQNNNNNGFNNNGFNTNNNGFYNGNNNNNYGNLSANQMTSMQNLDNSRAQANANITTAVSNGTLTSAQAQMFQNQLAQNANDQAAYIAANNFGFTQVQTILNNFNSVNTSINAAIAAGVANPTLNSGVIGNGGTWFQRGSNSPRWNRGRWNDGYANNYWTSFESALNAVQVRLQTGLNTGQLTSHEYRQLKAQYDHIANQGQHLKANGRNNFSGITRNNLERSLDDLNASVTVQWPIETGVDVVTAAGVRLKLNS